MKENKGLKKDIERIDEMASFCKKKGFVFSSGEIYGGLKGFYDFGPMGCELKRNFKNEYWNSFVIKRDDMTSLDGSIITHPTVWKSSGHVAKFVDAVLKCTKCGTSVKADSFIFDATGKHIEDKSLDEINKIVTDNKLKCNKCGSKFEYPSFFNLMFTSKFGAESSNDDSNMVYLRPETAQSIFVNFKNIVDTSRNKLPFGIAQIGKAFRNEISPRNFLFRMREFEQIEIEFFVNPKKINDCPYFDSIKDEKLPVYTKEEQNKSSNSTTEMSLLDLSKRANKWQVYWIYNVFSWFVKHRISYGNLRIREHLKEELAHYANACFDIEYKFPFGWKEIHGNADRGTFDLSQHEKVSKKKMSIFDEESKEHVLPYVATEPSQGIERALLAILFEAHSSRDWTVLSLDPRFSPIKVAVFPLQKDEKLLSLASKIHEDLKETDLKSTLDISGSIGKRYARQDEIGTPFDITVDFDSLEDYSVTIRDRDTKEQKRIKISNIKETIVKLVKCQIKFKDI